MSRRALRSRNVLRITRFLTVLVAVTAVVVGTVAPVSVATASASQSTPTSLSRTSVDATQLRVVKTTLDGFTPGNLISDAVFTNKNTMTEAQIQSFFKGKVANCRSGYTCLKDFKINSVTRPADAYCKGYKGQNNESAARIIYRVSQSCNINPHVLIVMLQKEQGLITHTWPSQWRYDMALGQGCPDTAPCDPNFVGFFHQIYGAARQMQIYMEGKWFQWYAPGKTWNIQYHPNRACGTSPVYIANKATAALYYYTPYQPNAAALKAGRGTGDSCSSYGNRNFYNFFTDWFGSTQTITKPKPKPTPKPETPKPNPATKVTSMDTNPLAIALGSNGTAWAYPYAKGKWGAKTQIATGLNGIKKLIGIADLDGDGHRDLLAVTKSGQFSVLYGNGSTTYGKPVSLSGVGNGARLTTGAGDFDGDGVPDFFTTNSAHDLLLWRGNGFGSFHAPIKVGRGWGAMNMISGGADLSGDGKVDLVARDKNGRLWLYLGNGSGGWSGSFQIGHGWGSFGDIINIGDFTGDGKGDLIGIAANGDSLLYRGAGGGKLGASSKVGNGWGSLAIAPGGSAVKSERVLPSGVGNLDGAGGNDVIAVSGASQLLLYPGTGRGGWGAKKVLGTGGWKAEDRMFPVGDFNGDGIVDLARVDGSGNFRLLRGKWGGTFQQSIVIGQGWSSMTIIAAGIDYDGDHHPDVLAKAKNGDLLLYRGNGSGGWIGGSTKIGHDWSKINAGFYAGDFNGDGNGDVIARATDGTLWIYPTNGAGGWGAARQIGHGWSNMTGIFSPGDFDGDGKVDVLARTKDGLLYLYRGNGSGGWLSSAQIGNGWNGIRSMG
ncbi:FG-GAP repeat domain-containing protein [Microbacterium sp. A82]|uniref:FG-GAP repeat domain-containing protein n=1 Tax=Microbacterium sp. A82 TaxID=3450452 RepID=UPI003F35002D